VVKIERYRRYDLDEVAQIMGVELGTVRRWVEHGMLPTLEIGSRHLVRGADLFLLGLVKDPSDQVKVNLEASQFDSTGNESLREQYVCIKNRGSTAVDMTGWHLQDRTGATYDFPPFTLPPGARLLLHTGKGTDTGTDLYWGRGSSVWRNEGDVVTLFDRLWNLVDQQSYGQESSA
jgi:excisionase family DNA binding protein